ncbi:MAG: PQQ-binding-like beta-propeller repeat protein [Acidobacteria bacterium]|nr:PQQ-binding-like beta-propeller repeat protein [Acidobacteriota bacterium]
MHSIRPHRPHPSAHPAPPAVALAALALMLGAPPSTTAGQPPDAADAVPPLTTAAGEWPSYGGDAGNTRYSPLDQIDASNFERLEIAWRFRTDNFGPAPEFKLEGTPVMAGGVVYATAGTRRAVVALDAATGELLWMHREDEGARAAASPRRLSGRGLAYWANGEEARILYVTIGFRLVALDARTGARVADFGTAGAVDLKATAVVGDGRPIDLATGPIGTNAAPTVAGDVVIVGGTFADGAAPRTHNNVKGLVQAFDVRTGERLWTFRTVPRPGEFGADTWLADSWGSNGNNGVWTQISADPELGIAYLPVETPTGDYYGGHRPGDNLFAESLVAVDLATGERRWHFQLVHHPLWGFDMASPPILADITVDGRAIKAVAQPGKQAFLYVFDRVTGEPVWPIEERPVPQGDVPGEWYSPTQPFPTRPPAYDRQGAAVDDLIDFTPELRAEAVELVSRYRMGPIFTPPVVSRPEGPIATLGLGAGSGGTNWPGGGYDPETNVLYVPSRTAFYSWELIPSPGPDVSDMRYVKGTERRGVGHGGLRDLNVRGLPLVKPPYGRLSAIDLDRGDLLWQVPHGATPERVARHPALAGLDIPRTGQPCTHLVGPLVTATLVVLGECDFRPTPAGRGAMLRAYDKATGDAVGAVFLPAPQSGSPMTYLAGGRQHIVLAIGGRGHSGEYVALRLPS